MPQRRLELCHRVPLSHIFWFVYAVYLKRHFEIVGIEAFQYVRVEIVRDGSMKAKQQKSRSTSSLLYKEKK